MLNQLFLRQLGSGAPKMWQRFAEQSLEAFNPWRTTGLVVSDRHLRLPASGVVNLSNKDAEMRVLATIHTALFRDMDHGFRRWIAARGAVRPIAEN
jgi:hypothetical protein